MYIEAIHIYTYKTNNMAITMTYIRKLLDKQGSSYIKLHLILTLKTREICYNNFNLKSLLYQDMK